MEFVKIGLTFLTGGGITFFAQAWLDRRKRKSEAAKLAAEAGMSTEELFRNRFDGRTVLLKELAKVDGLIADLYGQLSLAKIKNHDLEMRLQKCESERSKGND